MFRFFFIILLIPMITNCAAPGTALLSPIITGAKTKSAHQASLSLASSLSSNQFIKKHTNEINNIKKNLYNQADKVLKKINNK